MMTQIRMIIGLFLFGVLLAACGGGSQLTYKVSGDAAEAAVSYTDDNGETIAETVSLPWETSFEFSGEFKFSLTANNADDEGTVVCEVWTDERPIGSVQGNQFAECAGSITVNRRDNSTETSSSFRSRSDQKDGSAGVMPTREGEALMATAAAQLAANRTPTATPTPPPSATPEPSPTPAPTPIGGGTGLIAFTLAERDSPSYPDGAEIYIMLMGQERIAPLTQGLNNVSYLAWSPDGSQLAFRSKLDGDMDIYTLQADGSGLTRLADDLETDTRPIWSADGSQLLFASNRRRGNLHFDLFTMNADGSSVTQLTDLEQSALHAHWSPAHDKIVFTGTDNLSSASDFEIFVMNADGSGLTNLTQSEGLDDQAVWSPDGAKIAFVSRRDDNEEIYVMNADGSGLVRLTNDDAKDRDPSWSPDGQMLLFSSTRFGDYDIFAMNADGTEVTRLTNYLGHERYPAWQPLTADAALAALPAEPAVMTPPPPPMGQIEGVNGRFVFDADLEDNFDIYSINANGSDLRRLTFNQAKDADPAWSPDGSQVVFVSDRDGPRNLYIVGDDGLNLRRLTNNPMDDQSPHWSPDGEKIAFVSFGDNSADIFVINADGSGQTALTHDPSDNLTPAWSPDGSKIAFVSNRDGRNQLYWMQADGSDPTLVADIEGDAAFPAWSPTENWLAFTKIDPPEMDVYIIGSDLYRITDTPDLDAMPVWVDAPNGLAIAFVSNRGGNAELYLLDSEENVHQVTDLGVTIGFPDWTPMAGTLFDPVEFETYVSGDGSLTFQYPSAWLTGETPHENYVSVSFVSDVAVLQDKDFSQPLAFMLGEVWLTEAYGESDPDTLHETWVQGMDNTFSLEPMGEPQTSANRGVTQIIQAFTGHAEDGSLLYFTLKTVVNNGRFVVFAVGVSESGREVYAPIIAAILDSVGVQSGPLSGDNIDFTDPTAVLEAVFAAAHDEDFSYLPNLCDPLNMNDRDTDILCQITADHENKESFVQYFATGQIVGEVEYIEGANDTFARVNFLYGPNGDIPETIELILRDGQWYLLDF